MSGWVTALAAATTICEIMFKLSPAPDIYKVHRRKHIGEMAELPIITLVVNCNLWSWYGFVDESIFPIFVAQFFGLLAGIVYNVFYFWWSPTDKRRRLRKLYSYAVTICFLVDLYCILGMAGVLGMSRRELAASLGYAGVAFSLAMFASPLGTLRLVIQTKSSASISINISVMLVVATALWVATGVQDDDWFVAGANGAGFLLGCIQVVLYYVYKPGQHEGVVLPVLATSPQDMTGSTTSSIYKPMPSPVAAV